MASTPEDGLGARAQAAAIRSWLAPQEAEQPRGCGRPGGATRTLCDPPSPHSSLVGGSRPVRGKEHLVIVCVCWQGEPAWEGTHRWSATLQLRREGSPSCRLQVSTGSMEHAPCPDKERLVHIPAPSHRASQGAAVRRSQLSPRLCPSHSPWTYDFPTKRTAWGALLRGLPAGRPSLHHVSGGPGCRTLRCCLCIHRAGPPVNQARGFSCSGDQAGNPLPVRPWVRPGGGTRGL